MRLDSNARGGSLTIRVTVVGLLIKEGVAPERLAAAGFGRFDPIAPNDTKDSRAKNRPLEIILLPRIEQLDM